MNLQSMMAQAKKMQSDIMKKKAEIDEKLFPGKSEWVEVVFNGKKELVSLKITVDKIEEDDKEVLEDMLKIAINSSFSKIEKETDEKMGQYGNALNGIM